MSMESSWVSIIPFLLVIPISIWTKQVLPGLTIGLIVASYLIEPSVVGGIEQMITYLVGSLSNENNMKIIIFLYAFSGLIGMIKMAGGIKGFVESVSHRIKTKKGALFLTWVSTLGTFTAPSLRVVTIAPIMKALLQRVKMSKQELGFVIETTATPVVVLIPIATAYVGYMTSVIEMAFKNEGIEQDAYTLFIQSIPFNFFAIVMVFLGIYLSFFHPSKDKTMESSEEIGEKEETWHECHPAVAKELPSKPLNLLLPLFLVLGLTLFLTWWSGREKADGLVQAFIKADTLGAMVIALIITVFVTLLMFLFQKMPLKEIIGHFITGGNELMAVIILLAVVWGLSTATEELGFSAFITENLGWIPELFVAPTLFLFGLLISYFIGSSWGAWGILMPLGISLAHASGASLPIVIGAVFASGSFGAFTSPLSDTAVTISTILKLPVMEYSRYKLKPALIAAGISLVLYSIVTFIF